ncbi:unnamed protein product, partial [Polarella glacialis]
VDDSTPIITCVHDCQVVTKNLPPAGMELMKHDVPVDIIVTPTRVIIVNPEKRYPKPTGIYWELLSKEKFDQIKVLQNLKKDIEKKTGQMIEIGTEVEALPPLAKRGQGGKGGRGSDLNRKR